MKYGKASSKSLVLLISRISGFLPKNKKVGISDLVALENYLIHPERKFVTGSIALKFSAQKTLLNGTVVQLIETIEFQNKDFSIFSTWIEECGGEQREYRDNRTGDFESENDLPYHVNYSVNAIDNILHVMEGSFTLKTDQFKIGKPD